MALHDDGLAPIQGISSGSRGGSAGLEVELPGAPQPARTAEADREVARALRDAQASEAVRRQLEDQGTQLRIEKDKASGRIIIKLQDARTGEVIRQIPPEEILKIAEGIDQFLGALVDRRR